MAGAAETLKGWMGRDDCYDVPHADVAELQIEAANGLFQARREQIKYLRQRATEAGVTEVRGPDDLVGLLFAHTTYKSYPEGWLTDEKWPMLAKWVDVMSTNRVQGIDFAGIAGIDDWIDRMGAAGHYLSCSSGTSGKSAILNASHADMVFAQNNSVAAICWGASVEPRQQFRQFSAATVAATPRYTLTSEAMARAFARTDVPTWKSPAPPITLGQITGMVALRKRIAEGVARPEEIAAYDATSAERAANLDKAIVATAEAIVAARADKLLLAGMWGQFYKVAELVRAMGHGGDFDPGNMIFSAGGLKGAVLPPDYREYIFDTFNVPPERVSQFYSMQEIASAMPRCRAGRYHVPPWLICLLLDEHGEALVPLSGGETEGRAGFFDLAIDGRWNGVISGDRIAITYERCDCGARSPSIRDDIARYADLAGGDKITCAGTVDAYVRGL